MKKQIIGVTIFLTMSLLLCGCKKEKENTNNNTAEVSPTLTVEAEQSNNSNVLEEVNYFSTQEDVDKALQQEAQNEHTFEEPMVIVNPYGNSPLTAVAIFSTTEEMGGTVTVKGKATEDDITGSFDKEKNHIVPIYGLYAGADTTVNLTLDDGTTTSFTVTTDAVDFDTSGFEVEMSDSSSYDYSKLTFVCDFNAHITALDSKGDLRWFYNKSGILGVQPLANGHLAVPAGYTLRPLYYQAGIVEMDLLGKVYHEYEIPGGEHHDIYELSNGNLLVSSDRASFETVEDYVVELDRETGAVVWELDLKNLIDPSEGGSINRTEEDWFHNNAIWYDEASDTLLISGRHVDAIVAVDKSDKTLKWILGDPDGWSEEYQKYFFTPVGDNFEWQYAQHQVTMLSDGNIMCFDNGAGRTKTTKEDQKVTGKDVYSRAVVYHIDEAKMTIEQVWEFGKELGGEFNSEWVSGAISLENDPNNIWITSGANLYNPDEDNYDYGPASMFTPGLVQSTRIYQVKENQVVYKMHLNFLSYRTLRLSLYGVGNYNVSAEGSYLGSLGVTSTADINVDLTNAEAADNCTLTLDPVKMTVKASYTIPTMDDLKDSYLVLVKSDGTAISYNTLQTTTQGDENVTVNVNGYISTEGITGTTYDIYVVLGENVYNTGYKAEL